MNKEIKFPFPITYGIPDSFNSPITYSICSDGIYQTVQVMGKSYATFKIEGISKFPAGKQSINIPKKIPINYYWKIIEFFREVNNKIGNKSNLEAFILICYNYSLDKYMLYVPNHIVGAASVEYDLSNFFKEYPGWNIIMDLHSHHNMSAYFSGTDNKDDNRNRFSGVIGKLNNIFPESVFRFSIANKHIDIVIDDLFCNEEEVIDFDVEYNLSKICTYKGFNSKNNNSSPFFEPDPIWGETMEKQNDSIFTSIKYALKNGYTLSSIFGDNK